MAVEPYGARIDCIHNNRRCGYFRRLCWRAVQRIHEKKFTNTSTLQASINRKADKQRGRNERVPWKLLRHVHRQLTDINAIARQGVVAKDGRFVALRHQNERRGTAAAKILPGLSLQVSVEGLIAARKIRAVVIFVKRLNYPFRWFRHLSACYAFVPPGCFLQSLTGRTGSQKRVYKKTAIAAA
jgi:hypothetical protein